MQMAAGNPDVERAVSAMEAQLRNRPIVPEDLDEAIQLLEFVLQNPEKYPEVRAAAIRDGIIQENMAPQQFNKVFIISMLIALYGLQDRMSQSEGMAHGGLATAARRMLTGGRGGDTELVHVNRREAEMLRRMGGAGTVNPHTGLHEYKGIGEIIGSVLPVALGFIAPGIGSAIGGMLGAEGALGAGIGGALLGGATSALTGGNFGRGALMGGVGGALGEFLKPSDAAISNTQAAQAATPTVSTVEPSSVLADVASEAASKPMSPEMESMLSTSRGDLPYSSVGKTNYAYTPAGELTFAPGQAMIDNATGQPGTWNIINPETGETGFTSSAKKVWTVNPTTNQIEPTWQNIASSAGKKGFDLNTALTGLGGLAVLNALSTPQQQELKSTLSPSQLEYFNRPSIRWNWGKIQQDANRSNQSLGQYVSQNWNRLTQQGAYNMAQGGALSAIAGYAKGSGSGRADTIDARLSDGEYVIDAETVALLGDGSSEEGARRLDRMRSQIRSHKGKSLAKGKISPNAKSPLTYLKEMA